MKSIKQYIQSNQVNQEDNTFASIILYAQQKEVNGVEIWGENKIR